MAEPATPEVALVRGAAPHSSAQHGGAPATPGVPGAPPGDPPVLDLGPVPEGARSWIRAVLAHRSVLLVLAAKDFKVRYKRATFGVLWAVALPLVQSIVMITVFSRFTRFSEEGFDYAGYVLAGMVAWAYVSATVPAASTAIVDAASLTDKVWFPRALLVLSPVLANLIGLGISFTLIAAIEAFRNGLGPELVLVAAGALLLVGLVSGLTLSAAALQVTFRDVRFIVQAGMLVAFYATPILYPVGVLGALEPFVTFGNPFTGAVNLFQAGLANTPVDLAAVAASAAWTAILAAIAVRLHHRRDRLFVDLL